MSEELAQKILIRECCAAVKDLAGDAAEIGVHQGHSAKTICELLPDSTVYLFDTFCGFPAEMVTAGVDYHKAGGEFRDTSVERVTKALASVSNYVLVPGVFPKSANGEVIRGIPGMAPMCNADYHCWCLRFVHIDCDLYKSTLAALHWCWPLLVPGGMVLNDDYGCSSCAGAKKAVDEFCDLHWLKIERKHNRAMLRKPLEAKHAS